MDSWRLPWFGNLKFSTNGLFAGQANRGPYGPQEWEDGWVSTGWRPSGTTFDGWYVSQDGWYCAGSLFARWTNA